MSRAEDILKSHGLRSTEIRREVINQLLNVGKAITHQDMETAMPKADRVTLYRTLTSLQEAGIIHQVVDDETVKKYALCGGGCSQDHHHDNHVHFKCTSCGDTRCLENVVIPAVNLPKGYVMESEDLLVQGVCPECA
ncbi:MAG: transcriptional repressor [Bacteroidetes bacterium]|uniref:Transcriptional repressor n=1 Tax=Phaeocystidibacter marisrubri TaxID=1577780 RepID=A0A6L3ZJ36_9FLAO|nr:transcriptional repressor [Phaeocystidibacter marisrubri]KAB2817568.1 transcriptional repressor [Phaeocystidibacter marisrubri]TNE29781.1 MAG: transcriptional repressor [Bacteroidota bacterium]GGH74702.1 transcriptional regulator [Phaeocystidibacter marisrubri]